MKGGFGRTIGSGILVIGCVVFLIHCGGSATTPLSGGGGNSNAETSDSVTITPAQANIEAGQSEQFSAAVGGTASTAVTWSVSPAGAATISSSGLMQTLATAPAALLTVTATSTANTSILGSATVTVIPPGTVATTNNPLVATYAISVPRQATAYIQFGPGTTYGLKTWSQPTPASGPISIFVAGMTQNTTYHMQAVVQFPDGSSYTDVDHTFTTGSVPAGTQIPNFSVTNPDNMTPSPGIELFDGVTSPAGTNYIEVGATDLQSNLIWYLPTTVYAPGISSFVSPHQLPNGNFIFAFGSAQQIIPPPSVGSMIVEVDLAGDIVLQLTISQLNQELAAAGYNLNAIEFHHDVLPLDNGHIIALVNSTQTFNDLPGYPGPTVVLGDALVDLDQDLQPVWVWNEFDHLDINRHPMNFPDWTHTNAVIYSPSDGDLIVSMRHQNWVVKVNYNNGKGDGSIVWRLGEGGDFTLQGGTDPIDWFYAQHAVRLLTQTSIGTYELGMFDNGNDRIVDQNQDVCGAPGVQACYSTVPIFRINETAKIATVVWRQTLPVLSFFGGDMEVLDNGDIMWDASAWSGIGLSQIEEVTRQSQPAVVWQVDETPGAIYRAYRAGSLYPGVTW